MKLYSYRLFIGVYLSLSGKIIPNHGYVNISDIGSTTDTALLCYTNLPPPPGEADSGGDWFAPDGMVLGESSEIERGPMVVKLRSVHNNEGIYKCVVQDRNMINKTVYVGLYSSSSNKGIYFICITML